MFFGNTSGKNGKVIHLIFVYITPIVRHVLIKGDTNLYDPEWDSHFNHKSKLKKDFVGSLPLSLGFSRVIEFAFRRLEPYAVKVARTVLTRGMLAMALSYPTKWNVLEKWRNFIFIP